MEWGYSRDRKRHLVVVDARCSKHLDVEEVCKFVGGGVGRGGAWYGCGGDLVI